MRCAAFVMLCELWAGVSLDKRWLGARLDVDWGYLWLTVGVVAVGDTHANAGCGAQALAALLFLQLLRRA